MKNNFLIKNSLLAHSTLPKHPYPILLIMFTFNIKQKAHTVFSEIRRSAGNEVKNYLGGINESESLRSGVKK